MSALYRSTYCASGECLTYGGIKVILPVDEDFHEDDDDGQQHTHRQRHRDEGKTEGFVDTETTTVRHYI